MHPFGRLVPCAVWLLAACSAQERDAAAASERILRLVATDFTFAAPESIPAGLTKVRLVNEGHVGHAALITRLPEGSSADAYLADARAGAPFPVAATDIGGPGETAAADSSEVVLSLTPGRYAIVCWSDDHVKAGMIASLNVVAADTDEGVEAPPTADVEVLFKDFTFEHATPFLTGRQVLKVRNVGERPHNLQLYRFEPGKTLQDFATWRATRQGPSPATPVGGMDTMAPGQEGWVVLTLVPGRYLIVCGTPEGDVIHAQLGMLEEFEIH